jgi:hypothetical protein
MYGIDKDYIKNIKLPRYKSSRAYNLLTIDEIDSDKLTTLEKLNHLDNLKKEIEKRLKKLSNNNLNI